MRNFILLMAFISIVGCAPTSLSEYRSEGEDHIKKMISELSEIETLQQLEAKYPKLKKKFSSLVDLIVAARKFEIRHQDDQPEVTSWQLELSDLLKKEMIRIYEIEGCKELIEEIERDALHRLDLFEKKQIKPIIGA